MKEIAIVILNWNGEHMLKEYLPSVIAHSPQAQVIVADNASTDNSISLLEKEFPSVRRIVLDKNYGFAQGYQLALKQVDTPYYLLLNNDVRVEKGWLAPMWEYMESHPEVAACQPKIRALHHPTYFEYAGACGGYVDAWGYPYCRGRILGMVEEDKGQYDTVCSILWATGAALLIRSKDYWEVGGLDERFFAHQEEIDLCWRLRNRGKKLVCVPQSCVYHVGGGTLSTDNPHKTYLNFRNNLLLLYKNMPETRLRRVLKIRILLDAMAAMQFLLQGKWKSCIAVWRAHRDFHRLKPQFAGDRNDNLQHAQSATPPEQTTISILWKYYICRKKTFSKIHPSHPFHL